MTIYSNQRQLQELLAADKAIQAMQSIISKTEHNLAEYKALTIGQWFRDKVLAMPFGINILSEEGRTKEAFGAKVHFTGNDFVGSTGKGITPYIITVKEDGCIDAEADDNVYYHFIVEADKWQQFLAEKCI